MGEHREQKKAVCQGCYFATYPSEVCSVCPFSRIHSCETCRAKNEDTCKSCPERGRANSR